MSERHTFSVLVENKPGVLARVSGLFARRAFNIHSLAVGPTEDPLLSRITLVVDAKELPIVQLQRQLNKLVNVIHIEELEDEISVHRRLVLVKVAANDVNRTNVLQIVEMFRARIVDVVPDAVTVEATGSESKVKALLTALAPYGVKEIVQSGTVAIGRGARSVSEQVLLELQADSE
ncbi:MAG: acetolactate synthase small subunit [Arcanobacterium sp.]|nr:acetolactate synthase small subunit [Arcanobacterium sp.]